MSLARREGAKGTAEMGGRTGELPWHAKDSSAPSRKNNCALEGVLGGGGVHLPRAEPEEG